MMDDDRLEGREERLKKRRKEEREKEGKEEMRKGRKKRMCGNHAWEGDLNATTRFHSATKREERGEGGGSLQPQQYFLSFLSLSLFAFSLL